MNQTAQISQRRMREREDFIKRIDARIERESSERVPTWDNDQLIRHVSAALQNSPSDKCALNVYARKAIAELARRLADIS